MASDTFDTVYKDVLARKYPNEDTFRHHFLIALKNELDVNYNKQSRKAALVYTLEYLIGRRRSDIRIGNVLFELEEPPSKQEEISYTKKEQIQDYMTKFRTKYNTATVYGVTTNGWYIEAYENDVNRILFKDSFIKGGQFLIQLLSNRISKIEIAQASDFTAVFGLWG